MTTVESAVLAFMEEYDHIVTNAIECNLQDMREAEQNAKDGLLAERRGEHTGISEHGWETLIDNFKGTQQRDQGALDAWDELAELVDEL